MIDNIDMKVFLQQMLEEGRGLADRGVDRAGEFIGLPQAGEARDEALSNMGKGALAAGALALLLGTSGGRKLTGGALKLGSLAALGSLAYNAYNGWRQSQPADSTDASELEVVPIDRVEGDIGQARSERLIKAMIAAAAADGHIDTSERGRIEDQLGRMELDADITALIHEQLASPVDPAVLAAGVETLEEAAELYLVTRMVIDLANKAEREYLERLADALHLAPDFIAKLEQEFSGV